MTYQYIVAYVAGTTDEGMHSNWVPFRTDTEAESYVRVIKRNYDFSTITVSKILERHD
jgi:hypothetical protein